MKITVQRIFELPAIEKRDRIPFLYPRFKKESDDTYIAYLCFKRSLVVCGVLAFLNWVSYTYGVRFDFRVFAIDIPKKDFVEAFLFSFPRYTTAILLTVILPFHVILLRRYIDPRTFDLLWWNSYFTIRARRRRGKILLHVFAVLIMIPVVMWFSFPWPYYYMKAKVLQESYVYFLSMLALFSVFLSWSNGLMLTTTAVFWRYIGKYEGE